MNFLKLEPRDLLLHAIGKGRVLRAGRGAEGPGLSIEVSEGIEFGGLELDKLGAEGSVAPSERVFERVAAAIRITTTLLEGGIRESQRQSKIFFSVMVFSGVTGFFAVLVGLGLWLAGYGPAGMGSIIGGVVPEAVAALFMRKESEIRRTAERSQRELVRYQQLLVMIDLAESIEDQIERDRLKVSVVGSALGIRA